MTKKLVLTAFVALVATAVALAQTTDPQPKKATSPANKTERMEKAQQKDKTDQVRHAEERSNGAAYSGKGKGGEKGTAEREKKGKGKAKGHDKQKAKGKEKHEGKGQKAKDKKGKSGDDMEDKDEQKNPENGDKGTGNGKWRTGDQPQKNGDAPAPKSIKTGGERKPGDKPAPGTEMKKVSKSKG